MDTLTEPSHPPLRFQIPARRDPNGDSSFAKLRSRYDIRRSSIVSFPISLLLSILPRELIEPNLIEEDPRSFTFIRILSDQRAIRSQLSVSLKAKIGLRGTSHSVIGSSASPEEGPNLCSSSSEDRDIIYFIR
jgi:hypothetical protein